MLNRRRPARFAILCSRRAPGLDALLRSPLHGRLLEVVLCLASDRAFADPPALRRQGIPTIRRSVRALHAARGVGLSNLGARVRYDAESAALLQAAAVEWVLLDCYLYVLTAPMLTAFPGRILNIHDSDLTLGHDGRPRYPGLHATRDAVFDGRSETRATVHFVTDEVDAGPPLLRSWPFPVSPSIKSQLRRRMYDAARHSAAAHRETVMNDAWGVLLERTAELLATDRVALTDGHAWIDGRLAPWDVAPDGELRARATLRPSLAAAARSSSASTERRAS